MSYYNLSSTLLVYKMHRFLGTVQDSQHNSDNDSTNPPLSKVKIKAAYAAKASLYFLTNTGDSALGVIALFGNLFTLYSCKPLRRFAKHHLENSRENLIEPYKIMMKIINPAIVLDLKTTTAKIPQLNESTAETIFKILFEILFYPAIDSDNMLVRQIGSRFTGVLSVTTANIIAVVECALGMFAASLSLLTAGTIPSLNNVAMAALKSPELLGTNYFAIKSIIYLPPKYEPEQPEGPEENVASNDFEYRHPDYNETYNDIHGYKY